ncbi:ATP-binding protein [Candidatus Rariloculus sp.]|uniref:ATP-binding protein n=1 Tax=Candidatus Rariloculus sp. TaxID=3101265 RepID=UPI003D0C7685
MKPFFRAQKQTLLERLAEEPRWLILVSGPRQCGKTTLVQQVLTELGWSNGYVAADVPTRGLLGTGGALPGAGDGGTVLRTDDVRDEQWLVHMWAQARARIEAGEGAPVLALDEIQKIPNWSETVKGLWDDDRRSGLHLHVVLLGSSPLLVQRGVSESLAGRYESIRLSHWSFPEMSRAFGVDLPGYVYFGGYPGAASLVHDEDRWQAYVLGSLVEPNIESDILAMERVDKPALLKQLFELAAVYSGQILSYNKMLGQLQDAGNTTTLARYLDLLARAGLVTGLQQYSERPLRRRASSPKLLVLNTALMSASSEYRFEEAKADRSHWGRLVESVVGAHLYNTLTPEIRLHYWRENSLEVDYVLQRGRRLVSIEVKSGRRKPNLKGLWAFSKRFKDTDKVIVGEEGVPLEEFLSVPAEEWF